MRATVYSYCNYILTVLAILNVTPYTNSSPPTPEIAAAVKTAIEYYNNTMNLAERIEMVEQFYELEKEEGYFLVARHRIVPKKMAEIFANLEALEYEAKHKNPRDKKIIQKIKDLDQELSFNYGPKEANFRIQRDEPLIENMRAAMRMKTHWEGLMAELNQFSQSQQDFFHSYHLIQDGGIKLSPMKDPQIMLYLDKDIAQEFLNKYPKHEDFQQNMDFEDIYEKLQRDSKLVPKQTSQEIQALQSFLNGELVDPYAQEMLQGFIPDLNKKGLQIIQKMQILEATIDLLDEQSQNFANYLLDKRNEMHEAIDALKTRFESDYKDEL